MNPENFHLLPAFSLETLARELSKDISSRKDPMKCETILIMNYAQKVWLQQFIAKQNGICANIEFKTPEKFLSESIGKKDSGAQDAFSRNTLAWRIFKQLKKDKGKAFPYRDNEEEDFIILAETLADLFWHYQSFRPEMIASWESGLPDKFANAGTQEFNGEYDRQKKLWLSLGLKNTIPPAVAYLDFIKNGKIENPPEKLFVFAPTALPRIHMEMLYKLSSTTEIFFYYHNLSEDLWTETAAEKQILRERNKLQKKRLQTESELKWQELVPGNELLTSWGKAARPLAMQFIDDGLIDGSAGANKDSAPQRNSLLHIMQANIRENTNLAQEFEEDTSAFPRSLQIHIAHSQMREMEILRNDMMEILEKDDSVSARDILVMMPNVEEYAPFIRAVFSEAKIPFSIADKTGIENFSGIAAFMSILKISQGDIRLSEVVDLLNSTPLLRGLGIEEKDAPVLQELLNNLNARWGINADFRKEKILEANSVPASEAFNIFLQNNSWDFALQRAALSYMLGGNAPEIKNIGAVSISPAEKMPADAHILLGKFSQLITAIKKLADVFSKEEKTVPEWCDFITKEILNPLFKFSEEEAGEEKCLTSAIISLKEAAKSAKLDETDKVKLKTAITPLENQSWENAHSSGMLRGKITFCALQPLRNIPAKAIYLAGMSNGEFPRNTRKPNIDLIANWPKHLAPELTQWDRTPRDEDCLLLLEAILAAKNYLRISYIGRNKIDNSEIPPCAPISKFISYLTSICGNDAEKIIVSHKLEQVGEKGIRKNPKNNVKKTFPLSSEERERFSNASAEMLSEFYSNPAKFICEKRLFLKERWNGKTISDNDPETSSIYPKKILQIFAEQLNSQMADQDFDDICYKYANLERSRGKISALFRTDEICGKTKDKIDKLDKVSEFTSSPKTYFIADDEINAWPSRTRKYFRALEIATSGSNLENAKIISFTTKYNPNILHINTALSADKNISYWRERFLKDIENPPVLFEKIPTTKITSTDFFEKCAYEFEKENAYYFRIIFGESLDALRENIETESFEILSLITTGTTEAQPRTKNKSSE